MMKVKNSHLSLNKCLTSYGVKLNEAQVIGDLADVLFIKPLQENRHS